MREAIVAALRRDPDLLGKITGSLRARLEGRDESRMNTVAQAAEALEPIIEDAVKKRPSKLGTMGLKGATLLASLVAEDDGSNRRLRLIARGRSVGIVFVDVADFTAFTAREGDEVAADVISKLHALTERAARRCGGELVKNLGDGFLLAFPSASQAIRGAASLRSDVLKKRAGEPALAVRLRIAVHAGEPLIENDDLLGHDVNLTARLLDHCKPDGIVVSEAAKELAERRLKTVRFGRRRQVKVRGLAGKVALYPVSTEAAGRPVRGAGAGASSSTETD